MLRRLLALVRPDGRSGSSLVVASFWSLVLRMAGMAVTFLVGVQLARYLGPAGFGIYGFVIGAAMLLSAIGQMGLPTLATREVALAWARRDWGEVRGLLSWFTLGVALLSILLGGLFVTVTWLWPSVGAIQYRQPAIWGAILVPAFALTVLVSAQLRALDRIVLGQSLEILVRPLLMSIFCVVGFLSQGALSANFALFLNMAASALALLLGWWWLAKELPEAVRRARPVRRLRTWFGWGAPLAVTDMFRQLDGVYAVLMMSFLTSPTETGIFRVALSSVVIVQTPLSVLQVVLAPTLARLHGSGEREKLQFLLTAAAALMLAAGCTALLVVAFGGQWLISTVFGHRYAGAWLPFLLLTIAQAISAFFGVGFVQLAMGGAERELTVCYVASVGASIAAAIPLILAWGASGAAAAAIVGMTVTGLSAW